VSIKSFPDYKHLLQGLYIAPQLEEFQSWIIFQQDGAPPHRGSHVRWFLDATFPNRWNGRDGPTPWPPRSPDITPLDFFLWGYVNLLTPNVNYSGRTAPLTSKVAFYIFIQQIEVF